jgi:hypothetical protein
MIPKLSGACYAIRSMVQISNINTPKSIYYEYYHHIIKYGKILGGKLDVRGSLHPSKIRKK